MDKLAVFHEVPFLNANHVTLETMDLENILTRYALMINMH